MVKNSDPKNMGDGVADAMATTAIISIIVLSMYIWLSGMPS
ncbi:methionine synthase [Halioglobus sp.]|nr:methionine synthase [Halioglobus sp.]